MYRIDRLRETVRIVFDTVGPITANRLLQDIYEANKNLKEIGPIEAYDIIISFGAKEFTGKIWPTMGEFRRILNSTYNFSLSTPDPSLVYIRVSDPDIELNTYYTLEIPGLLCIKRNMSMLDVIFNFTDIIRNMDATTALSVLFGVPINRLAYTGLDTRNPDRRLMETFGLITKPVKVVTDFIKTLFKPEIVTAVFKKLEL